MNATSPQVIEGFESKRSETEVRAIRARRARLEADLIEEGASDATVTRLATDDTAARMIEHERRTVEAIAGVFFGPRP